MIEVHLAETRGLAEHGWLYSRHSFSFADYYDPERMGFGLLRVLNDDVIEPGQGFPMHRHDNMEIVTIVLEGTLEHRDSQGNHGVIRPGEVQRMSAGSGIRHSEYNHSQTEKVHLLQIWVYPRERGIVPGYEQKTFSSDSWRNRFLTVVSGEKNQEALYLHQYAAFVLGEFDAGQSAAYSKQYAGNGVYAFVIKGECALGDHALEIGDGAGISPDEPLLFSFSKKTFLLLIEVPQK